MTMFCNWIFLEHHWIKMIVLPLLMVLFAPFFLDLKNNQKPRSSHSSPENLIANALENVRSELRSMSHSPHGYKGRSAPMDTSEITLMDKPMNWNLGMPGMGASFSISNISLTNLDSFQIINIGMDFKKMTSSIKLHYDFLIVHLICIFEIILNAFFLD